MGRVGSVSWSVRIEPRSCAKRSLGGGRPGLQEGLGGRAAISRGPRERAGGEEWTVGVRREFGAVIIGGVGRVTAVDQEGAIERIVVVRRVGGAW